jgi:hypothetical protein
MGKSRRIKQINNTTKRTIELRFKAYYFNSTTKCPW